MYVNTLLLYISLQLSGSYMFENYHKWKVIQMSVPRALRDVVLKERDLGGLDLYEATLSNDMLQVKAAVARRTLDVLDKANLSYTVLEHDLRGDEIQIKSNPDEIDPPGIVNDTITFLRDLYYEEIIQFLDIIRRKSTSKRTIFVETIGKSYQGRDIKLVRIGHPKAKNIMFFDAGIHGREWLSITTALHLITNLVEANHTSPINRMNWYIVPLVNPDGYVYTYTKERFHRKNMNFTSCLNLHCMCGVDLNRNFEYKFGDLMAPCSQTFPGAHAYSEKETQVLSKVLKKYSSSIKLYVALHTKGCLFLHPWGYAPIHCDDYKDFYVVAQPAADAMNALKDEVLWCRWMIRLSGTVPAPGAADDYAKGVLNIKFSFTMELQGGPGNIGFTYNRSHIKPYVAQNYVGITTLANNVQDYYSRKEARSRGCNIKTATPLMYIVPFCFIIKAF